MIFDSIANVNKTLHIVKIYFHLIDYTTCLFASLVMSYGVFCYILVKINLK